VRSGGKSRASTVQFTWGHTAANSRNLDSSHCSIASSGGMGAPDSVDDSVEGIHELRQAPMGFGTDILSATHALINQPTVALVSVSLSCLPIRYARPQTEFMAPHPNGRSLDISAGLVRF